MKISKVMEGQRDGEVRCLTCFESFRPAEGAERTTCPKLQSGKIREAAESYSKADAQIRG